MSDSELSASASDPADNEIEKSLRRVVRQLSKADEDVTVNKVREVVETELGLNRGFFKDTPTWKRKSKEVITDAVEHGEEESSPEKPKKPAPQAKAKSAPKAGRKRKSNEEAPVKKRPAKKARKVGSEDEESELELSDEDVEEEKVKKPARKPAKKSTTRAPKKTKKRVSESDGDDNTEQSEVELLVPANRVVKTKRSVSDPKVDDEDEVSKSELVKTESKEGNVGEQEDDTIEAKPSAHTINDESELSDVPDKVGDDEAKPNGITVNPEDDESDLSSLIDEPPAKKKRQKKTAAEGPKPKSKAVAKGAKGAKPKAGKELNANEEEIKRLQGWLVKCGIRKMWWKELAPYPTSKEKISHLKKMLDDAGMTGRYSNEKAKQIKESRELAAELEAVEEFNDRWGQSDEEGAKKGKDEDDDEAEEKAGATTKRRLPKGFIDFGDSGDDGSD